MDDVSPGSRLRAQGRLGRRWRGKRPRPLALALQGGGAHGAFTWGVLDRLLEADRFAVEALSGASAGAVNAVVFASGWSEGGAIGARAALHRLWQRIGETASLGGAALPYAEGGALSWAADHTMANLFIDLATRLVSPYQFNPLGLNPLRQILLELVDFPRLRQAAAPRIILAATHVREGRARLFGNDDLDVDAVSASACLPLLQPAVEIGGEAHWDGGLVANPPILPLVEQCGARDILLVQLTPAEVEQSPVTAQGIARRVNQIVLNAALSRELDILAMGQRVAREGLGIGGLTRRRLRALRLHRIDGSGPIAAESGAHPLFPRPATIARLHELGRAAAAEWLNQAP
jgi:NTE family protein